MRVCILGAGLTSLTLAKALVNKNIYVDIVEPKKKIYTRNQEQSIFLKVISSFLIIQ